MITPDLLPRQTRKKKSTHTRMSSGKRKRKKKPTPLKSISQALKCKLLSLVGSLLYMGCFLENLQASNLGTHPILGFSCGTLVNYIKMSCCCWDFLLCYFTALMALRTCGEGLTLEATFALCTPALPLSVGECELCYIKDCTS